MHPRAHLGMATAPFLAIAMAVATWSRWSRRAGPPSSTGTSGA
jgi:hypothetical protein